MLALGQAALPCSCCSLLSPSSRGLPRCPPQLQPRGGGRAGHGGSRGGLWTDCRPTWVTPQPPSLSSTFQAPLGGSGAQATPLGDCAVSKGRLCPGAGLAVSAASSSAELTSKFTSDPLLFFLALLPYPSCPLRSWLLRALWMRFPVMRNALSHHRAFPRHYSPLLTLRGSLQGLYPPLPALGNAFAFCCHVCPCPCPRTRPWQAGAGTSPSHGSRALPSLWDALNPLSHPDMPESPSALKSLW